MKEANIHYGRLDWILAGSQTGHNHIALPTTFEELHILIVNNTYKISFVFDFIKEDMPADNTTLEFRNGYYMNSTSYCTISLSIDGSDIWLDYIAINSSDVSSATSIKVYYK